MSGMTSDNTCKHWEHWPKDCPNVRIASGAVGMMQWIPDPQAED